ncbi:MAG: cobalamin biosynthesis protein [Methylobacteriaceae bacterium]|nr:cobalamin biosynthesis protein [Methylobacteriaceae bacterium]
MGGSKTVSRPAAIAIGLGCRRGVPGEAITALVKQAIAAWPPRVAWPPQAKLFTIEDKHDEAGMQQAAQALGLELVFLPRDVLGKATAGVKTHSPRAFARFGISSVAEAAALAGAGPRAALVVSRISARGVTCAIAAEATAMWERTP